MQYRLYRYRLSGFVCAKVHYASWAKSCMKVCRKPDDVLLLAKLIVLVDVKLTVPPQLSAGDKVWPRICWSLPDHGTDTRDTRRGLFRTQLHKIIDVVL